MQWFRYFAFKFNLRRYIEVNLAGLVPAGREEQYTHEAGLSLTNMHLTDIKSTRRACACAQYGPEVKSCWHVQWRAKCLSLMTLNPEP
jgi:hypothetical protein